MRNKSSMPPIINGLQDSKVQAASTLGFTPKDKILYFGTGAVTNTLLALTSQCMSSLQLQSRHADHLEGEAIQLHHRGTVYEVNPGVVNVVTDPTSLQGSSPTIIVNGRQVGGNYDEIFDACGKTTKFVITAQNGQSSQALYKASVDYIARNPTRADIIKSLIGLDAAMFVKMSSTDSKSKTILQPGAKWLFGAFSLKDGSGTGIAGSPEVDSSTLAECERFVDFFSLLDATDGKDAADVKLNAQAVSGKLVKTANNIGGNYGAAIITRLVQTLSDPTASNSGELQLDGPLPYGVLHPQYDIRTNLEDIVGTENLDTLTKQIEEVREMSLSAVAEYYELNEAHFLEAGISKDAIIEAAVNYWTEFDASGNRIPSRHPPTHALAMFERRPSEPLLDDVISSGGGMNSKKTKALTALNAYHQRVEQVVPMPYAYKEVQQHGWLEGSAAAAIKEKATTHNKVDELDLVSIKSIHYAKPIAPTPFLSGLQDMGEHAISYMERLGEYKAFYESLECDTKAPFLNLTIGGVYRDTPPRTDVNASRGYVTHLTKEQKELTASIYQSLGCDVTPDQVAISPMRAKLMLQHALGLFQPGVLVAHKPNYKATVDAAEKNFGHTIVEVDVRGRYSPLFDQVRVEARKPSNANKPIILLLVCPQNPTAIAMNEFEEAEFHSLIKEIPQLNVLHDIAYQGYHERTIDAGKRYRDHGMPHPDQVYMSVLSTSKSMYASGQPALWSADKNSFPFLTNHYQRVATGPTSTFVHDLKYYYETLDETYMRSVEDKLQKPMVEFVEANKKKWGVDFWIKPDGPPFITLDVKQKLKEMGLNDKGLRELTLRLGIPVLVADGCLRIALTGFDKSTHETMLPLMLNRLDHVLSMTSADPIVRTFKAENPFYVKEFA